MVRMLYAGRIGRGGRGGWLVWRWTSMSLPGASLLPLLGCGRSGGTALRWLSGSRDALGSRGCGPRLDAATADLAFPVERAELLYVFAPLVPFSSISLYGGFFSTYCGRALSFRWGGA